MPLSPVTSIRGGFPLGLAGATAATRYVGATASGAPAAGTFAVGDFVIDQSGSIYVCTAAGSPGTWSELGAGGGFSTLFDQSLGANAASIDSGAGGFSTSGVALLIVGLLRTTQAATIDSTGWLRFNGDATAGAYSRQAVRGDDTTASAGQGVGQAQFSFMTPGAGVQAGVFGSIVVVVPGYGGAAVMKAFAGVSGWAEETSTDQKVEALSGVWLNTAAISRVQLIAATDNLAAGSRLSVFRLG